VAFRRGREPGRQQICLENVLALDPHNEAARQGLKQVRSQKAALVYTPPLISESRSRGKRAHSGGRHVARDRSLSQSR